MPKSTQTKKDKSDGKYTKPHPSQHFFTRVKCKVWVRVAYVIVNFVSTGTPRTLTRSQSLHCDSWHGHCHTICVCLDLRELGVKESQEECSCEGEQPSLTDRWSLTSDIPTGSQAEREGERGSLLLLVTLCLKNVFANRCFRWESSISLSHLVCKLRMVPIYFQMVAWYNRQVWNTLCTHTAIEMLSGKPS